MNQLPTRTATRFQLDAKAKLPPLASPSRPSAMADARLRRNIAEGLQLTRASTIALTRLQLALAGGDRRQAMAAIDRLHAIDGEIEHLVEQLPPEAQGEPGQPQTTDQPPATDDPMAALGKHLADQKLALAFEKLALASGISGPDLVSADHPLAHAHDSDEAPPPPPHGHPTRAAAASEPPRIDWHAFPDVQTVVWDRIPTKLWGLLLAFLVTVALAAAAVVMTR